MLAHGQTDPRRTTADRSDESSTQRPPPASAGS